MILGAWIATIRLRVHRDGNCRSSSAAAAGTGTSLGAAFLVEKQRRRPARAARQHVLDEPTMGGVTDRNSSRFAPSQKSRTHIGSPTAADAGEPPKSRASPRGCRHRSGSAPQTAPASASWRRGA